MCGPQGTHTNTHARLLATALQASPGMAEVLFRAKLHRDSADIPWGFRLQGGADYNKPLTLLRVCILSKSDMSKRISRISL